MAVTITAADLAAIGISGPLVDVWIEITAQADACLDKHNVPEATQRAMKLAFIRHLFTLDSGGQVTSERAPSGASRSYAAPQSGSTAAASALRALDRYGCLTSLLDADRAKPLVMSIGPGRRRI